MIINCYFFIFIIITILKLNYSFESISICDKINEIEERIVAIGDIHGSFEAFQKILKAANITNGYSCEWIKQEKGVILIQIGDVVDRGSGATESWKCLDQLQDNAPENSKVIRLVGNHELMWLQGLFRDAHEADTKEKRTNIVNSLKRKIQEGKIVGSYYRNLNGIPVMFIHAGFRPQMVDYITSTYQIESSPEVLSSFVNNMMKKSIEKCMRSGARCALDSELFSAGPERGGGNIGGPFWTDYRVLSKVAAEPDFLPNMIQV